MNGPNLIVLEGPLAEAVCSRAASGTFLGHLIFECAAMTAEAKLHFQSKVLEVAMASLHSFACFLPLQQRYKFLHQNTWHLEVAFQSGNSKKRKRIHLGGGTRAEGR